MSLERATDALLHEQAISEVIDWDEYCQGYGPGAELLICVCGEAYPRRGSSHYCSYDIQEEQCVFCNEWKAPHEFNDGLRCKLCAEEQDKGDD